MTSRESSKKVSVAPNWERPALFAFGIVFVSALIVLAIVFPEPTAFQQLAFRVILALATAGIGAFIPGLLHLELGWASGIALRAGGALGLFALVYLINPATLFSKPADPPPAVLTYRICSGEYERNCQPHDIYQYCYVSPEAWAKNRCQQYRIIRLDTRDGNKCGYSLDQVICTGPK